MKIVNVDISQYISAIKFISRNNPAFIDQDDHIKETLDKLIKWSVKDCTTTSTMGLTVSSYVEYDDEIYVDIYVDPSVGKDSFYIKMAI